MNAVVLMAVSLVVFQGNDQKVTGSIGNDSGLLLGNPYAIVFPRGTLKLSGPVTKFVVKTSAGQLDKSGKFVVDKNIYSGEATTNGPEANKLNGQFNWFANSFTFPGNPAVLGNSVTVKATLEVYTGTPPVLKLEKNSFHTFNLFAPQEQPKKAPE